MLNKDICKKCYLGEQEDDVLNDSIFGKQDYSDIFDKMWDLGYSICLFRKDNEPFTSINHLPPEGCHYETEHIVTSERVSQKEDKNASEVLLADIWDFNIDP